MVGDVGEGTDGRYGPLGLEAVVFVAGGNVVQHRQVRLEQQRPVVEDPSSGGPLSANKAQDSGIHTHYPTTYSIECLQRVQENYIFQLAIPIAFSCRCSA